MPTYTNNYSEKIFNILSPLIGVSMTKSVIRLQASKIGKNEDNLEKSDMIFIAEGLSKSLVVFLGSDKAKQISEKIAYIM